jgi:hypothetical protein
MPIFLADTRHIKMTISISITLLSFFFEERNNLFQINKEKCQPDRSCSFGAWLVSSVVNLRYPQQVSQVLLLEWLNDGLVHDLFLEFALEKRDSAHSRSRKYS